MSDRLPRWVNLAGAAAAAALSGQAVADFIPSHGDVIHLNPFASPGWSPPAAVLPPPPGPGVVVGAPLGGPFLNDILGPIFTIDSKFGVDALLSASGWHWEVELDLDPYGAPIPPVFFSFFGGPLIGPFIIVPAPGGGPDITLDIHQPDFPAELGPFGKHLVNLLPVPVGWGTSVTEDRVPAGDPLGKEICFLLTVGGTVPTCQFLPEPELATRNIDALALVPLFGTDPSGNPILTGIIIDQRRIPEPGSLALLAGGLLGLGLGLRRGRIGR